MKKVILFFSVFLISINALAQTSFNLDYPIEIDKQIKRQIKKLVRHPSEKNAKELINNIRLKFIIPALEILPEYIKDMKDKATYLGKKNSIDMPEFIERIYYFNSIEATNTPIYGDVGSFAQNEFLEDSLIYIADEENKFALFKTDSIYVAVIELRKLYSAREKDLINWAIKKHNDDVVKDLVYYEQGLMIKFLSQFITSAFEAYYYYGIERNYKKYFNILKQSGIIYYIVKHGKNGKINARYGFSKKIAKFEPNLWEKSSVAKSYFYQEIKYGRARVMDVTNPIYINRRWIGAIRIGIKI